MKKLFRASKPGATGPGETLPSPEPPATGKAPSLQHHNAHDKRRHHAQGITPFPIDMGRNDPSHPSHQLAPGSAPNQAPTSAPAAGATTPRARGAGTPTLAEMQQMEQEASAASFRREERERAGAAAGGARPRAGTASSAEAGAWPPPIQPGARTSSHGQLANSPDPPYPFSSGGGQQPSPPTQPAFYLPPGAGPPSPHFRPATPTRLGHMQQPSISNSVILPPPGVPGGADGEEYTAGGPRSRAYSSASQQGRISDHEGSVHPRAASPMLLNKPAGGPAPAARSPLANAYSDPSVVSAPVPNPPSAGTPLYNQYNHWATVPPPSHTASPHHDDGDRVERIRENTPRGDKPDKHDKADKEKKRGFWSNWGDRKQADRKHRNRDANSERESREPRDSRDPRALASTSTPSFMRQSVDVGRPSLDEHGTQSAHGHASSVGHGAVSQANVEAGSRSTIDVVRSQQAMPTERPVPPPKGPSSNAHSPNTHTAETAEDTFENDVSTAIYRLCTSQVTTYTAVAELCERVNRSESPEAVGKEAARQIRKVLKSGHDSDRRMSVRVWFITMRLIKSPAYRHYATNKKFMAAIEPIVMSRGQGVVSQRTYDVTMKMFSGLTAEFGQDRGCEGLLELWRKAKRPDDPDFGWALPADFLKGQDSQQQQQQQQQPQDQSELHPPMPQDLPPSRPASDVSTVHRRVPQSPGRTGGPYGGPTYESLPHHNDDVRRLIEECNRARASARTLTETLVFTSPEELDQKPVIKEFYRDVVLAHESLTTQMDWARTQAAHSRQMAESVELKETKHSQTIEESAFALLIEAHDALTEAMKQHEDLEAMAVEKRQLAEARERSKKETRMDRRQQMDMLMPGESAAQSSSSRSPSPAVGYSLAPEPLGESAGRRASADRRASVDMRALNEQRNPDVRINDAQPMAGAGSAARSQLPEVKTQKFANLSLNNNDDRSSRTPSPDKRGLPMPPPKRSSPPRASSPLGRGMHGPRPPGPRPLPNPINSLNNSQSNLNLAAAAGEPQSNTTSMIEYANGGMGGGSSDDGSGAPRPSRKALGKRRAVVDDDNDFDPDDMFKGKKEHNSDRDSITADDVYLQKKVVYAYDAFEEKWKGELAAAAAAAEAGDQVQPKTSPVSPTAVNGSRTSPNGPVPASPVAAATQTISAR